MPGSKKENGDCYLFASACAATVNYPLWKASAIAQSGFQTGSLTGGISSIVPRNWNMKFPVIDRFIVAMSPPYRAAPTVILGMTWARAAIFYGSETGRRFLKNQGYGNVVATCAPPLLFSSLVQCMNMPFIRITITMQDPQHAKQSYSRNSFTMASYLIRNKGISSLWHGLSAGLAKTVPKYLTSVVVKDIMEEKLPKANSDAQFLARATVKAVVAGLAGAILTNPMDVLRNEMFKTDKSFMQAIRGLHYRSGQGSFSWMARGLGPNLIAVSVPISITIFLTDVFINFKDNLRGSNFVTETL